MVSGWAVHRRLACFKYLAQSVFSSPFPSGKLDQDKASMTLAQSQQQAVTLGKPALRAKGKIPFPLCLSENASKGCLARSAKLPRRRRFSVKEMWPLGGCRSRSWGVVQAVSCQAPWASGPASLDKMLQVLEPTEVSKEGCSHSRGFCAPEPLPSS